MKNKTSKEQIRAYKELLTRLKSSGICDPKLHILDNEASKDFQKEIEKQCKLQMVSLDTHRRNIAERAIQSFKNHFISILAGVDPSFPIFLWKNCSHKQSSPSILLFLKCCTERIKLRIHARQSPLQCNTIGTIRVQCTDVHNPPQEKILGKTHSRWLVFRSVPQA